MYRTPHCDCNESYVERMVTDKYEKGGELLKLSGLSGEQIKELRLPKFNPSAYNLSNGKECLDKVNDYCNSVTVGQSNIMMLVGENGTGKSHLAIGATIRLAMSKLWSAKYVDFVAMNTEINANRNIQGDMTEANYLQAMKVRDVLLIDDIDKVPPTPAVMKLLLAVVNYRINRGKPIIVTANHSISWLEAYWLSLGGEVANNGKAIADRITGGLSHNIITTTVGNITSYRRL